MANEMRKVRGKRVVIGVARYRPEQWDRLVEVSADAGGLDDSYAEWVAKATARFRELTAAGHRLEWVDVEVEALLAWCLVRGRPVDGAARSEYAAAMLEQSYAARRRPPAGSGAA